MEGPVSIYAMAPRDIAKLFISIMRLFAEKSGNEDFVIYVKSFMKENHYFVGNIVGYLDDHFPSTEVCTISTVGLIELSYDELRSRVLHTKASGITKFWFIDNETKLYFDKQLTFYLLRAEKDD